MLSLESHINAERSDRRRLTTAKRNFKLEMQQSKMIFGSGILLAFIWLNLTCTSINAAPYQELEPRKGHVPVYIRVGDEPLSQIHPALAEAFNEATSKPLIAESLVTYPPEEDNGTTLLDIADKPTTEAPLKSTTISDIASFDVIKAGTTDKP